MQHRESLLKSEQGSFVILFALTMMFLLTLFAYTLDTGFFIKEKNRYQSCAEAAALTAVDNICFVSDENELKNIVMNIVRGSNLSIPEESISVETGFYDTFEEYESFTEYKDFVKETSDNFPEEETFNAVLVTIGDEVKSLTGFHRTTKIKGAAVAYLPRVSIVSGKNIKFDGGMKISINNGNMYAERKMYLRGPLIADTVKTATGRGNGIYLYEPYVNFSGGISYRSSGRKASDFLPEIKVIKNHIIPLETFIKKMKKKADRNYAETKVNNELYAVDEVTKRCYFDFTKQHDDHEIIYIDIPGYTAYLTPFPCIAGSNNPPLPGFTCVKCSPTDDWASCDTRQPFGSSMKNMTIVAICDVIIPIYRNINHKDFPMGGTGFEHLNIVSKGGITFSSGFNSMNGINFFCDSFKIEFMHDKGFIPPDTNHIRVLAEGKNITFAKNDSNTGKQYDFDLKFGPPCPPVVPSALGFLEPGSSE
ncbi:MAG: hypothetical protein K8S13_08190 [Desulfobacula sp.]|uniref:hypothetical protein n=1 Tax=Desulfobacula sp. TaxID=2593537 RepID=UPI0025C45241|nr:hypothetical protein [Desulfobacula sp.]MCD4719826.1 hypothetical protein [Desulfobacula sp.]